MENSKERGLLNGGIAGAVLYLAFVIFCIATTVACSRKDGLFCESGYLIPAFPWIFAFLLLGQILLPKTASFLWPLMIFAILLSILIREQDAKDVFGGQAIAFDNTAGKKKVKRNLPDIGDENFIWTNPNSSAWPVIKVRKGRIIVSVFAPTVMIAKKFMHHVLEQIDAS